MAGLAAALPEYELLGELGRGAMGVVLLGRHRSLGRDVAIKELPPAFAADESVRKRFLREARTVAGLNHPHVVVIHDFIDRAGHLALVMERLPGGTVWDRFTGRGITVPTACALLLATAAGLDHAHRHGVLHRDIKPENLMFTGEGQLKVTDFGMAKVMGGEKTLATADGVVLGTPAYMAPEQAEGSPVGPAVDVYACGTMLYELVSGRLPFASAPTPMAMLVRRITNDPPPVRDAAPNLPAPIASVIDTAIARSVGHRFEHVVDLAVALGDAAARTWGPEWLAATGLRVVGSEAIERAARQTGRAVAVEPGPASDDSSPPAPGQGHRAPRTVLDEPDPAGSGETRAVVAENPRRRGAVDLREVSIGQVVDITELGRPAAATAPMVVSAGLALVLAAALLAGPTSLTGLTRSASSGPSDRPGAAATIGGRSTGEAPVEVDFSQPLVVEGLGAGSRVRLEASLLGVPVGVSEAALTNGRAEIDPAYLRWTTAGAIDVDFMVDDDVEPRAAMVATTTHSRLVTAPTLLAGLIGLYGLASVQGNLRGLRTGSRRLGPSLGLLISGGLLGASAASLVAIAKGLPPTVEFLAVGAGLAASSAAMLGEAARRRGARRGVTVFVR
ncbi:MAG: serine/threonine protein kinase [Acidimicrobiia bacterium]|nr:serine/threonine protein kinase [Acidimicrobiia bacterium]